MTVIALPDPAAPAPPPRTIPDLLSEVAVALIPFVRAWRALPVDIRAQGARNLADVLGVFPCLDTPAPTVADLGALVAAFLLVTPDADLDDLVAELARAAAVGEDTAT